MIGTKTEIDAQNQDQNKDQYHDSTSGLDPIESDSAKEDNQNLKYSSYEEYKKMNSDCSIISDYSSENSDTYADSDGNVSKNLSSKSKFKLFDTEYPKMSKMRPNNKRSKSLMFKKKKYIENVVNEESIDEERDNSFEVSSNPYRFANFDLGDDILNFSEKSSYNTLKIKRISSNLTTPKLSTNVAGNSNSIKNMFFMDTVVEVKEDGELRNEHKYNTSSPRIKYLKDNFEYFSMSMNSPHKTFYSKDFSLSVDNVETIAEDNNENLEENIEKPYKRNDSMYHKLIESVIDKEENYEIKESKTGNEVCFDVIEEETVEEDFLISCMGKNLKDSIPIADEVDQEDNKIISKKLKSSSILETDNFELINEMDELDELRIEDDIDEMEYV